MTTPDDDMLNAWKWFLKAAVVVGVFIVGAVVGVGWLVYELLQM